ncbi:pilus assembly FimT family protein [Flexistipes sp.]|uniref:pilus assembly FimT family protein n=1 Tax=Flexistipes sp. TaxID=3088135 RepID=UPI002E1DCB3D|nr:prepilin-type N-terminal cleavage/methylation domain-containing protein [Flexistipes sp.]
MDRKVMTRKGVTLIELLVAIAILVILLAIAVPNYNEWREKNSIENDVHKMYGLLSELRTKAFTEKMNVDFSFNGTNDVLTASYDNSSASVNLQNEFEFVGSDVSIDTRGTYSGSSIKPVSGSTISQVDCISVDDTRIAIGKWNGSCEHE